jgi:cyclophilin family peptidyl-prolyl cis-trans isomerase
LDITEGTEPIGRLTFELYTEKAPKTCEKYVFQTD